MIIGVSFNILIIMSTLQITGNRGLNKSGVTIDIMLARLVILDFSLNTSKSLLINVINKLRIFN